MYINNDELRSLRSTCEAEITDLQSQAESIQASISSLGTIDSASEGQRMQELNSALSAVETQIEGLQAVISSINAMLDKCTRSEDECCKLLENLLLLSISDAMLEQDLDAVRTEKEKEEAKKNEPFVVHLDRIYDGLTDADIGMLFDEAGRDFLGGKATDALDAPFKAIRDKIQGVWEKELMKLADTWKAGGEAPISELFNRGRANAMHLFGLNDTFKEFCGGYLVDSVINVALCGVQYEALVQAGYSEEEALTVAEVSFFSTATKDIGAGILGTSIGKSAEALFSSKATALATKVTTKNATSLGSKVLGVMTKSSDDLAMAATKAGTMAGKAGAIGSGFLAGLVIDLSADLATSFHADYFAGCDDIETFDDLVSEFGHALSFNNDELEEFNQEMKEKTDDLNEYRIAHGMEPLPDYEPIEPVNFWEAAGEGIVQGQRNWCDFWGGVGNWLYDVTHW